MDRAVVLGLAPPALLLAGPVPALHGAGRQGWPLRRADRRGRCRSPASVGISREKSKASDEAALDRRRHRPQEDAVQLARGQSAREDGGAVDLAVVVAADPFLIQRPTGDDQRGLRPDRRDVDGAADLGGVVVGVGLGRALDQGDETRGGVVGGGHQVPAPRQHRLAGADHGAAAPGVGQGQGEPAILADLEPDARALRIVPLADDPLRALGRRGRPDHRRERERAEPFAAFVMRRADVRAGVDRLRPALVAAVERARDLLGLEARALAGCSRRG